MRTAQPIDRRLAAPLFRLRRGLDNLGDRVEPRKLVAVFWSQSTSIGTASRARFLTLMSSSNELSCISTTPLRVVLIILMEEAAQSSGVLSSRQNRQSEPSMSHPIGPMCLEASVWLSCLATSALQSRFARSDQSLTNTPKPGRVKASKPIGLKCPFCRTRLATIIAKPGS
jgi:hypothetical protein